MADDAELTIEELKRLRRAAAVGDADRLKRIRAGDNIKLDVKAEADAEPSTWESIKKLFYASGEDDKAEGRRNIGDAITRNLPTVLSATDAVRRQRAKARMLDRLAE
jgi:hypothetical protein